MYIVYTYGMRYVDMTTMIMMMVMMMMMTTTLYKLMSPFKSCNVGIEEASA